MSPLAAVVLLVATGVRGAESDPADCHCLSWQNGWQDAHAFPIGDGNLAYHCAPTTCHVTGYEGLCSAEHNGCGGDRATDLDVDAALISSAGFLDLALRDGVVYNPDRQALQVVGCDGRLTASLPVSDAQRIAVLMLRAAFQRQLV
jgi:hypothetical protein